MATTQTVNPYDQASRYLAKRDPLGLLRWLLPRLGTNWIFHNWLDTRTIPFPGQPDRICDTVACLLDKAARQHWWALVLEFQSQPDEEMFGRLLEYLGRLWRELRPTQSDSKRHDVVALVVNLTGRGHTARDLRLGRTGLRTCLQVGERNLADESAARTLRAAVHSADTRRRGAGYNKAVAAPGRSGAGRGAAGRLRRPGAGVRRVSPLSRRLERRTKGVGRAAV